MEVECAGTWYLANAALAGVWLFVLVVGPPFALVWMGQHKRQHYQTSVVFSYLFGECLAAALLFLILHSFAPCTSAVGFTSTCSWWEAVVMCKKLMLLLVSVFIEDPQLQGILSSFCAQCASQLTQCLCSHSS